MIRTSFILKVTQPLLMLCSARERCRHLLSLLCFGFVMVLLPAITHAASITVTQAVLEKSEKVYRVQTSYQIDLSDHLKDVLNHGVPLYFTEDFTVTRSRWYWFDKTVIDEHRTARISYNVLTDQYHVATDGLLQRSFESLPAALDVITHPARWVIEDPSSLDPNTAYKVSVKLALDVSKLPKPFQVNAINDRDWRLSSPWKEFTFTPE